MEDEKIVIKGARENNLKNISLEIPKNKLIVFTGLSGSGKTTLAFDTIFAEGQRRYVESLSSYARQFLGNFEKPDVDSIEGLSPAISIDQKTVSHNPRSTVGTVTEIYDYLRLLFGRIGTPYCPNHNEPIISLSPSEMTDIVCEYPSGTKIMVLAPIVHHEKGTQKDVVEKIKAQGFMRLRVDSKIIDIEEFQPLDKNKKHDLDVVVDRLIVKDDNRSRIFESIETALKVSDGLIIILHDNTETLLSQRHTCRECGFSVPKLEPRLLSFNSPLGYCPDCKGIGFKLEGDLKKIVLDDSLSINEGAIRYFKHQVHTQNLEWQEFKLLCDLYNIPRDIPFRDLSPKQVDIVLNGSTQPHQYSITSVNGNTTNHYRYIEGIKTKIERLYNETTSDMIRSYYELFLSERECTTCHGSRLNEQALSIRLDNKNIYQVCCMQIKDLRDWIIHLREILSPQKREIARLILNEIENRANFLCDVGLEYLTLSRISMSLSGGEAQRIRLSTQIGSRLSGVLYVLDEPSIGLHQRDSQKLIKTLKDMVKLGNTLIVVEHDEEIIRSANYIVDLGPRAGDHGGEVVAQGTVQDIMDNKNSITGKYLSGELEVPTPKERRKGNGLYLHMKGASQNNLKHINVDIPLGTFTCVTGVSGSGKSSLINQTLYPYLRNALYNTDDIVGEIDTIEGIENVDKVVDVSQEPIGRTPRSNPATYIKLFDEIRDVFANTIEAKARGYQKGRFSFNVPGGRCEKCQGGGVVRVNMNFLPDVYVKCDECEGKRYNEETLQITYKGLNIYQVLELTVEDALTLFKDRDKIYRKLKILDDVGLGYIKLGQAATTLSGGEAQRVKLANELQKRPTGKTVYILDEPTTGLHADDVKRLLAVLNSLVDHGDTVIVIEHNLDVIKNADYIIDLGPEGGDQGGSIVATGTPEEVAKSSKSYTGIALRGVLKS
ncbi:MAG: excinuclease ABC subunit UvrA [Coprobacillus sp.]|nr:excinuclease ABC subunit UvrA [Coprobacillus sp.]